MYVNAHQTGIKIQRQLSHLIFCFPSDPKFYQIRRCCHRASSSCLRGSYSYGESSKLLAIELCIVAVRVHTYTSVKHRRRTSKSKPTSLILFPNKYCKYTYMGVSSDGEIDRATRSARLRWSAAAAEAMPAPPPAAWLRREHGGMRGSLTSGEASSRERGMANWRAREMVLN